MTHPPVLFDPERAAALSALGDQVPTTFTPEMIALARDNASGVMAPPSDEEIGLGGTYTVAERTVPGPAGDPDISLLICTPVGAEGPRPAIYHTHGGGMILGDNRSGIVEIKWSPSMRTSLVDVWAVTLATRSPRHSNPATG